MAFVRGKSTLDTPGVDTNIGKEKREQDESRQHASDVNKGLAESGVSFDSRTQVVDASGYSNARRPYDQYIRENPLAGTIAGQVDVVVNNYSPKVRVNDAGTGLVLSGTKTALESDYAKELRSFLTDALQYQDLKSQAVADAIEKINNDIRQQIERSVVEGGLKTNYDTYKDYAHALEVTTSTNPMKKAGDKNKIFGLLKDGTVDYKTPKDWEDYYRKNYSTADRANLYKNALARYKDFSSGAIDDATEIDLALITPYLVMSGGGRAGETNAGMPIYGFNTGERIAAFNESLLNEIGRLIEGGARAVWETVAPALNLGRYKASRVRDISSVFGVDSVDSEQIPWESEENYTNKINSLIGKNVNELTDDEKVFMAASFTLNPMGDWGETDKSYAENVLDYITNDNGEITEDINRITGYDSYIHSRNSLSTTEKYTEEVEKKSEQLASGRDWLQERVDAASVYAPISSSLGAMAGTLMRMWAESVIISTATGGVIAPASISDSIADGIINMLGKASASGMTATTALQALQHPVGKFILSTVAELPEDVVQTVIDDVMTGRAEDIVQLVPTGDANKDMEKLGESFAQNLAFRLAFTPIHAGTKTFKDWRAARAAAKASGVDKTVPVDIFEKNQKLREAADSGSIIDVGANSATVRNPDGTEEVLDNVAMLHFAPDSELAERYPGIAEMVRKKGLVSDTYDVDISQKIDTARKAVDAGEFEDVSTGIIKKGLRYDENGELVDLSGNKIELENNADSTVIYRGQPFDENGALRFNYESFENGLRDNAFHFMTKPDYAANFGDSLIYSRVKNDNILGLSDFEDIKSLASFYANNIDELAGYAEKNGLEKAQLLQRIDGGDIRAIAEFSQKPIISIYGDDSLGTEEVYFPGIDEDFDKSLSATTLASSTPDAPIASEANIKMADDIQKALDSSPYDRTIKEIVADKYATSDVAEAPDSSSYRWESPDVTKTYNTEAEVFADMPTGKNLTEVRQWEKNAHSFYMNRYMKETMPEFTEKYPTVDEQQQFVRNMDYLFDLQRIDGETLEVGTSETARASRTTKAGAKLDARLDSEIESQRAKVARSQKEVDRLRSEEPDSANGEAPWDDKKMSWREGTAKAREIISRNSPIDLANEYGSKDSLAAWLREGKNEAYRGGDADEGVLKRWNALPEEVREEISKDPNFSRLWENYSPAGAMSHLNVDFVYLPDTIDRIYADYLWENSKGIGGGNGALRKAEDTLANDKKLLSDLEKRKATAENIETAAPSDYKISGSAIGKTYENEGIVYTVNEDDVRFYLDTIEPIMNGLREAGAAGQGREAFTITGYLPHSDYDPTILTAEDSMQQGVLWREYTGASTTDDDGNFSTGWLNPDLTARYSTFVHNMLWDSLGDNVVVAKYMEEFNADGLNVAANTVEKMVGGRKRLAHLVSESDSVKAVVKNLLGDGELPTEAQLEKAAKDLGSTDIVHNLYRPVYGEARGLYQTKSATSVKLMSKADWMRSLATGDGTLYDNGGAMVVNGAADAKFMAKRITDAIDNGEKLDVHQMFVEYLMQNHRRTAKGAGYIADKWMGKIAQKASNGGISSRALTAELGSLIYGEGANRLFRFIGRMDTSQLTSANRQALDSLLFRHSALSKIKNTSGISAQINKWTNRLISARMKSLFWLNYKNAVLQASECIRIFTEFKFGDARATIKRLATDADFRATVDEWVDMLVPERFVKSDSTAATGALDMVAEKTSFKNGEMTVNKFSADDIRKFGEKIDEFGRAPVELGETMKNRVMMAGILQEAERKGLTGNELFNYVNQRFERVGLAANEMGRLNASDNPLFRLGANLKTFQIRQFRMFINNIHDMNGAGEAATYIIKNLGWKLGLALIMGKLGYSTAATLGLDPFDLMDDDYTGVDEENYAGLDYAMLSPVAKLFLSGGFTGYINDAYWAARKAYEDNATVTEQTENQAGDNIWPGLAMPGMSFDNVFDAFSGFIPGFTAGKRVYQMNELLETGWATSASGNKMYEAPNNPFDIATGYLFGRSNTPNARAYYQNPDYLQGLLENGLPGVAQQFGREFGGFRQFDPTDRQNYSDWFNGTAADEQQWNSGYYYFLNKVNDITDKYQNSLSGYVDDAQREELSLSYNRQIAEIEDQLNRFTAAYEAKHPDGIDANKMRNLVNVLNIYEPVLNENEADALERRRKAYDDALYRYTQAGLPAVTSYERGDEGVEVVYSPQVRAALQGRFGLPEEAAQRVKELYNDKWKKLNQQYRDRYYNTKGSKQKKAIQEEYISIVRQDLDPIVSLYGSEIFSNDTVEDIVEDVFNSMIPKYGQTAKSYLKNAYKNYHGTINYTESGNTTLSEINNLLDQGKAARAKALARTLLQRVQENRTSLTRQEMERLQAILND